MKTVTLLFFLIPIAAWSQSSVELALPAPYEIDCTKPASVVRVPLKLTNATMKDIVVPVGASKPVYARLNNLYDDGFASGITMSLDKDRAALLFDIKTQHFQQPGTYECQFLLNVNKKKQSINVSFLRPAAVLDTIQRVRIKIVGDNVKSTQFVVRETGRKSNIESLVIRPFLKGFATNSQVIFPKPTYAIKAGDVLTTEYTVNDKDLLLGKTSGVMLLSSPELAAPVVVPMEITKTRAKYLIAVLLGFGLLMGFVLRYTLKNWKTREEKRLEADVLLVKIEAEVAFIKDNPFLLQIGALTQSLKNDLKKLSWLDLSGDTTKLSTGITSLTTSYNAAKTVFDARIKPARDNASILESFFRNKLTGFTDAKLSAARTETMTLTPDLRLLKLTEVENRIQNLESSLKNFVSHEQDPLELALDALIAGTTLPKVLPDSVMNSLKARSTAIKQSLAKINFGGLKETTDSAWIIDAAVEDLNAVVGIYVREYDSKRDATLKKLRPEQKNPFEEKYNAWRKSFLDGMQPTSTEVTELEQLWTKLLTAGADEHLGDGSKVQVSNVELPSAKVRNRVPAQESGTIFSSQFSLPSVANDARKGKFLAELSRILILLAFMVAGAYGLYAPSFIGTTTEMITIVLFAFGLDLTWEGAATLLPKKP